MHSATNEASGPVAGEVDAGHDGAVSPVAMLSDIHSNLEALEAVLADPDIRGPQLSGNPIHQEAQHFVGKSCPVRILGAEAPSRKNRE